MAADRSGSRFSVVSACRHGRPGFRRPQRTRERPRCCEHLPLIIPRSTAARHIGQGAKARRRVLTVQPEIEGEMIAAVPAEITTNGMPCSAAMPATRACVPSPPATPSRSAPWKRLPSHVGDVNGLRPADEEHLSAKRSSALCLRSNFSTFRARLRIHDRGYGVPGRRSADARQSASRSVPGQRQARGYAREQPSRSRRDGHPQ